VARDYVQLSRVPSHALRHEPLLYELELDADGWVAVAALREEREIPDQPTVHAENFNIQLHRPFRRLFVPLLSPDMLSWGMERRPGWVPASPGLFCGTWSSLLRRPAAAVPTSRAGISCTTSTAGAHADAARRDCRSRG
jgi:hypothetical protein